MSSLLDEVAQPQGESTSSATTSERRPVSTSISWRRCIPAILICLTLVRQRAILLFSPLPLHDFVIYWASGRLFLFGSNPYSATAIFAMERSVGWPYAQPFVLLYPPWALPFVAMVGALPFQTARYVWLAASMVLETVSAVALWRYFGGEKKKQWMAIALVLTFLPAGAAEHMGQITPLILAGLTAFLFSLRRKHYLLAGVCFLALALKPHLLYLVIFAIVLWAIQARKWLLGISAILTIASATVGAILFNHNLLGFFHGTAQAALDISCGVGGVLRSIFGMQHTWLQLLPTVVGTAWFAFYWKRHRHGWTWEEHLPLVLLVALGTSPYSWADDYVLALPALAALAVRMARTRTDWLVPSALYLVVQIVIFTEAELLSKAWMATASLLWLVLYCAGTFFLRREESAAVAVGQA